MEFLFIFAMLELACFSFCRAFARIFSFCHAFACFSFWLHTLTPQNLKARDYEKYLRHFGGCKVRNGSLAFLLLYSSNQQKVIFLLKDTQNLTKLKISLSSSM